MGRGINGKAAPPCANLQHLIVCGQLQTLTYQCQFVLLCLSERAIQARIHCRGIHHGRVKKGLIHGITQVIMRQNIGLGIGFVVIAQLVFCLFKSFGNACKTRL